MLISLLVALAAINVAYIVLLDRRDIRDVAERAVLLQRIQAPEAAVYEHAVKDVEPDGSSLPLSDAELAEREERERVIGFIERHENGHV